MIDELQYGIQQEVLAMLGVSGGTVILHTDFKDINWPTYIMPLILISFDVGDLNQQFLGGTTMEDWTISFSAYTHRPDVSGLDPTGNAAANTLIIDTVRRRFSAYAQFASDDLIAAINKYGFKFTYMGKSEAEPLEHPEGLCFGKKVIFGCVGLDEETEGTNTAGPVLDPDNVQQIAPLPAGSSVPPNSPPDPRNPRPPYPSYGPVTNP